MHGFKYGKPRRELGKTYRGDAEIARKRRQGAEQGVASQCLRPDAFIPVLFVLSHGEWLG